MARPRLARDRLRDRYASRATGAARTARAGPSRVLGIAPGGRKITLADVEERLSGRPGGYAYARMEGGREVSGTAEEWVARAGPTVEPRPESVAGYKRQRRRMIGARETAAETLRKRYAPRGGRESPAEMFERLYGMDPSEAHSLARHPGMREYILAQHRKRARIAEADRSQSHRLQLQAAKGKTSHELLGRQLSASQEARAVQRRVAGAQEERRQKDAATRLGEHVKTGEARRERDRLGREAKAGSIVEKRRREKATETQRRRERLEDRYYEAQDKANEITHDENLRGRLQAQADRYKAELDTYNAKHPPEGNEAGEIGDETIAPEMPGGETVTPRMYEAEGAGQPPRSPGEYHTAAEVVSAIHAGEFDMNAPGGAAVLDSLDPKAQDELRAWFRKGGHIE